jgi:hypothetical protein
VLTARRSDGGGVFADPLRSALQAHPDVYEECLERHFTRHLRPFAGR